MAIFIPKMKRHSEAVFAFYFLLFFQFDFVVDVVGVVNVDIAVAVVAVVIVVFDLTLMAGPDLTFFSFNWFQTTFYGCQTFNTYLKR